MFKRRAKSSVYIWSWSLIIPELVYFLCISTGNANTAFQEHMGKEGRGIKESADSKRRLSEETAVSRREEWARDRNKFSYFNWDHELFLSKINNQTTKENSLCYDRLIFNCYLHNQFSFFKSTFTFKYEGLDKCAIAWF